MVGVSVWAGAMQIPHSSTHVHRLQFFHSPAKLGLFGAAKASWFWGWVLASTEGHTESCDLDESDKRFMLGLIHQSVGFLKS